MRREWLEQLWRTLERVHLFDWVLDRIGLWPILSGVTSAAVAGLVSLALNAPKYLIPIIALLALVCGVWLINEGTQLLDWLRMRRKLHALGPGSSIVPFLTLGRLSKLSVAVAAILALGIYGYVVNQRHVDLDFGNVTTWSVSVNIAGLLAYTSVYGDSGESVIALPVCRFYNLSNTQRRLIDVTLVIPTKDKEIPEIRAGTETFDFWYKRKSMPGIIDLPIVREPASKIEGSKIEGRLEIPVSRQIYDKIQQEGINWIKYIDAVVYITEHRSGKTIKLRVGESYDAATSTIHRP